MTKPISFALLAFLFLVLQASASNTLLSVVSPPNASLLYAGTHTFNASLGFSGAGLSNFTWNYQSANYTLYDANLLVMYNFDNVAGVGDNSTSVADLSPNGNNGTLSGSPSVNSSGKFGGSLTFSGSGKCVTVNPALFNGLTAFTISVWFNTGNGWLDGMFSAEADGSTWRVTAYDNSIRVRDNSGNTYNVVVLATIPQNVWQQLTVTYNGTQVHTYINGDSKTTTDVAGTGLKTDHTVFRIGSTTDAYDFSGSIDEFRMWNRSFSDAEVAENYRSNLNKYSGSEWTFLANESLPSVTRYTYGAFTESNSSYQNYVDVIVPGSNLTTYANATIVSPANGSAILVGSNQTFNVSVAGANPQNLTWNFNGTNFTAYDSNLVLMYNFDNVAAIGENSTLAVDVSKSADNATLVGSPTLNSTGRYNGGLYFDGGGTRYAELNVSRLNGATAYTISLWFDSASSNIDALLTGESSASWRLAAYGNYFRLRDNDGQTHDVVVLDTIPDNRWTHLTMVYDGANSKFYTYINAGSKTTTTVGTAMRTDLDAFKLGRNADGNAFTGSIDEFRMWGRPFSDAEVAKNYYSNLYKHSATGWTFTVNESLQFLGPYAYGAFTGYNSTTGQVSAAYVVSACGDLSIPDTAYSLTGNISWDAGRTHCFVVTASNVTLDLSGYTINGDATDGHYCVYTDQNATTVRGGNISNCAVGVYTAANFTTVFNNTIFTSASMDYSRGVYASGGWYANVTRNNISVTGTHGRGIYSYASVYANASYNNVTAYAGDGIGIFFDGASLNSSACGNNVTTYGDSGYAIYVYSSQYAQLFSNTLRAGGNSARGILLDTGANDASIWGNNITTSAPSDYGVRAYFSHGPRVFSNAVQTGGSDGICVFFESSDNASAWGNNLTSGNASGSGVRASYSSNCSVFSNLVNTSGTDGHGVYAYFSNGSIYGNVIQAVGYGANGVRALSSPLLSISGNYLNTSGTDGFGIYLLSSSNLSVFSNNITASGSNGRGISVLGNSLGNAFASNIVEVSGDARAVSIGLTDTPGAYSNNSASFTNDSITCTGSCYASIFVNQSSSAVLTNVSFDRSKVSLGSDDAWDTNSITVYSYVASHEAYYNGTVRGGDWLLLAAANGTPLGQRQFGSDGAVANWLVMEYFNASNSTGNFLTNHTPHNFTLLDSANFTANFSVRAVAQGIDAALVYPVPGWLNVTLVSPTGAASQPQNRTFQLVASVACVGSAESSCGWINGTARYNLSGTVPNAVMQGGGVAVPPFYAIEANPLGCGLMSPASPVCTVNWTVNASGAIGDVRALAANFSASRPDISANETEQTDVTIVGSLFSITISSALSSVSFGADLVPGSDYNAALGNSAGAYNITCSNAGGICNVSIVGNSSLVSGASAIGLGNITWNTANEYPGNQLSSDYAVVNGNMASDSSQDLYFWLSVPPAQPAGDYLGNFTISGHA